MAKTDQELAQEEMASRQYMYGGTGPFSQFISGERREILSPESTQVLGFASGPSGVEYITETIPAEYGPAEYDPSYSPVRRGLSALGDMLGEAPSFLGFRGPDEQAEAIQGVGSSLRDALFGTSEYMSEQARAAASGGEYFDPETGRTVAFDPTIVMGGGSSGGGPALASGFRRSGNEIGDTLLYSGGGRQGSAIAGGSALRGLDMDQGARMQRAQDLGFDTERTAYRGLSGEYDPNKAGNYQMFTSSPEDAGEYGRNVVSSYLRKGNNLVVDGGRNNFNSIPVRNLPDAVRANLHSSVGSVARTDDIAYAAQAAGYDSVSINNVFDKASNEIPIKPLPAKNEPMSQEMMDFLDVVDASKEYKAYQMLNNTPDVALPPEIPKNYDPTTIDIIFDPKNIRSIEAEFDPDKMDSSDLLSSVNPTQSALRAFV